METRRKYPTIIKNNPLYSYFWYNLREDKQNEVVIVYGRPGSCKSSWALKVMADLDLVWKPGLGKWVSRASFTHVVFSVQDLVKLATSNLPKGSVIIYDEAGVESDNTSYHERRAQILRWVLQLWRFKNIMLIITLPSLRSLTVGVRRLATCTVETFGRRFRQKKHAYARVVMTSHKLHRDKEFTMEKFLRFKEVHNGVKMVKRLRWYKFGFPDKVLAWHYEKIKREQALAWFKLFGDSKMENDMSFMNSLLGLKGGSGGSKVQEEAEFLYSKFKGLPEKIMDKKNKPNRYVFEKAMRQEGVNASEGAIRKAYGWLRNDVL